MSGGTATPPRRRPALASVVQLTLAWAFVGIPLLWGVLQTLRNAVKLFH